MPSSNSALDKRPRSTVHRPRIARRAFQWTVDGRLWTFLALACAGCAIPEYALRPEPAPIESAEVHEFERQVSAVQARDLERRGARTIRPGERLWGFDIDRIVQRLSRVTERPSLVYTVRLIPERDPNAAALADGRVYLTNGMLHYLASRGSRESELAFIVGHELAHINAQHLLQRYQYLQRQSLVAELVGLGLAVATREASGTAQQLGVLARDAVTIVNDLAISGYSQQQELEADQLGMRYCLKAGYDPQAALTMVEDFKRFDRPTIFLSTHPYTELRAEYLRRYLQDLKGRAGSLEDQHRQLRQAQRLYPPGSVSWQNLQKQLDALDRPK